MSKDKFNPQWVASARNGSQDAVTDLYNYCYQMVYLTTKSLIKGDEDTVLDVLQDTFIKALTSLDQLGDDIKFPAWIKAIARNKALDWLRRNQKVKFESMDTNDDEPELQFEDNNTDAMPEVYLDQQETARLVREILNSLSDGQRMAVSMYYYQEMTIPEIARVVGCSVGTIKAQLYNGRKKIEEKVCELEKQGTKLYGFMPIPFFGLLLRNMNTLHIQPNGSILGNIMQNIGIYSAATETAIHAADAAGSTPSISASSSAASQTSVAGSAAGKVAKTAGVTAGHVAKGKIIAGVLAVAVIGGAGGTAYVNHVSKLPEPETSAIETIPEKGESPKPEEALNSMETEIYNNLLNDLQDSGSFLQYAHMEDLNGDGTDELMVLHDNTKLTIYSINEGPDIVYEDEHEGFMYFEEYVKDKTYAEAAEEMSGENPGLGIRFNTDHTALILNKAEMQTYAFTVVDCQTWDSSYYIEVDNDETFESSFLRDGKEIDYNEFMSMTEQDYDYEFSDQLNELLSNETSETDNAETKAAKTVYAVLLRNHLNEYPEYSDTAVFQLLYIDEDEIPELAIADQGVWGSGVTLYTYINGHAQLLGEKLGSNGTVYYIERKNQVLSSYNKDSGEATLYQIDNGVLIPVQHSTFQLDSQGNETFTIDGETVSSEEGYLFWGWDDRAGYVPAGSGSGKELELNESNISSVME